MNWVLLLRYSFLLLFILFLVYIIITIFQYCKHPNNKSIRHKNQKKKYRQICLYAYYEKDENYKSNLDYFLNHGIYSTMDYLIIINGECSVPILPHKNVRVLLRENIGYDFGAYAYGLSFLGDEKDHYDYFFFMNTSVRGPFMFPGEDLSTWSTKFTDLFQGDIHLVGCTINVCDSPWVQSHFQQQRVLSHVQSYVFVLDRMGLDLLEPSIFSTDLMPSSFIQAILDYEVGMSARILKNNWNIACTAKKYQGYDYRKVTKNFNLDASVHGGDPCYQFAYFGETLDAREIIFIKTNRNLPLPSVDIKNQTT
jgi:hypothetical protein